jgi:hypothetical protein
MADKTRRVDYFSLADAKVNVTAYNATCAPGGGFGMILWVKPQDLEAAAKALGV